MGNRSFANWRSLKKLREPRIRLDIWGFLEKLFTSFLLIPPKGCSKLRFKCTLSMLD
jgi:hypothetical protein